MSRKKAVKDIIPLLRGAIESLSRHPVIILPFLTIAFLQVLALEIFYFSPRYPLSGFFNPIVRTLWGERFIHYPDNFIILPRLFQYAQVPLYIFISSFFIAVATAIIAAINDGKEIKFMAACRQVISQYVHIFTAALLSFLVFYGIHKGYTLLNNRALQISSTQGIYYIIKMIVTGGAAYYYLLFGILATSIFAFVFPIIAIEKKKVFAALGLNFKYLWGGFWCVASLVALPTVLYIPVLLLKQNMYSMARITFPEGRVLILLAGIIVTMLIDAIVYTAVTTYYLLQKENS